MSLTITLRPEVEARIREDARHRGVEPETLAARRVEEADLLEQISHWIAPPLWHRYRELQTNFDDTSSEKMREEFLRLNNEVEMRHAERLGRVLELARLRNVTLNEALDQLGIAFPLP